MVVRAQKAPTAAEVIAMFRDAVDLPVTDDGQKIADQAKTAEPRYARMKASPDAQQRNKADLWYQQIARLQNDRPTLLKIVYAHFTHLADAALESALSSRVTTLTPVLYQQLQGFAEKECQCAPTLAQSFAATYLNDKALKIGEPLVVPHLVVRLKKEINDLQRQWELFSEKLSALNEQWILENRSDEKLRLRKLIDDTKAQRDQVEEQLKNMEHQLDKVGSDAREGAGRNDNQGSPVSFTISIRKWPFVRFAVFAALVLFTAFLVVSFYPIIFPEIPTSNTHPPSDKSKTSTMVAMDQKPESPSVATTTPPIIPAEPPKPVVATTPPIIPAEPPKPVVATTPPIIPAEPPPRPAVITPPAIKPNLGQLILELTPPARASLDGFHHPDDGNNVAATHSFSDLEPRTYRLTVKREGYEPYTRIITIENGITTKLQIHLEQNQSN